MRSYTMYVCEVCGKESRDAMEIKEHEASHLGLTIPEYEEYLKKQGFVRRLSATVSITNNEITRKRVDDAIEDLLAFENAHGIKDGKLNSV